MKNVQRYILSQLENKEISQQEAVLYLKELKQKDSKDIGDIAVIGVACRLPMADNAEEYWDNIINGRNCFIPKPIEKLQLEEVYKNLHYAEFVEYERTTDKNEKLENYIGPFIKDFDKFDAGFFGIPPREARYVDPEHRIFLETAWSALEDAGYSVGNIKDTKTGVFVGRDGTNSINYKNVTIPDPTKASGTWEGILASRINYHFNLKGPAVLIDTACSSGLVATHEACLSLRNGDCEMAIAGGIGILPSYSEIIKDSDNDFSGEEGSDDHSAKSVNSKDNRIRSFDKNGSGTVFGEGVVTFLLKPLKNAERDNDNIYAVIKGSAINSDGASNGITAPNPLAQEELIIDAWKNAKVSPETISYIETHGTGTLLGDPIEILGITNAFSKYTDKKQFCGVGSVKTNIGHLIGASGCANMLKVILAMNHHVLPPTLYFQEPNPHINFIDSPIYVVDKAMEWTNGEQPLRAGVSAFGFSGTNCHMIVEEYKGTQEAKNAVARKNIFTISAKTLTAMNQNIKNFNGFLKDKNNLDFGNVCFTANTGRGHYGFRLAIVAETLDELKEKISIIAEKGASTVEDKQIYYGVNRIVSDKSQRKAEGEISENELRDLTSLATNIVGNISENDESISEFINLCELYVKGANVEWSQLYSGKNLKRVPLPTYAFDRIHYWGDPKISNATASDRVDPSEQKHPLVEKCLVESMTQSIYRVYFNLQKQWVLQEHKIAGNNLVSGTTFVEICKEALSQYYKSDNIVLEDLVFINPLIAKLEDDDIETHIVITKGANNENFAVVSKHFDSNGNVVWMENLRGTAHKHNDEPGMVNELEKFKEAAVKYEEFALQTGGGSSDDSTSFGPRWQCVKSIFNVKEDDGEVMCVELELPNKLLGDLKDGYRYHPGMLDDAINAGLQSFTGSQMYLPFSYKNMKIFKNLPKHFFSILRKSNKGDDSEIIGGSLVLADVNGNVLAEIEECTLKKVNNFSDYVSNSFCGARWVTQNVESYENCIPTGNILIFKDHSGLADKLAERIQGTENSIYYISFGDEYKKVDDFHYVISGVEEDYHNLFSDIGENSFSTIYHMSSINFEKTESELNKYSEELNYGLYSLLYLNKAVLTKNIGNVNFVLLTDNAHDVNGEETYIKPANTAFLALAKTTVAEFAGYTYRCIDIDSKTKADIIIDEILREGENSFRTSYRSNVRYKEILTALDVSDKEKKLIDVKENGVYIITGGTGGLGLEVALSLGALNKCNICMIARRPIPNRQEWNEILEKSENKKICNLIQGIVDLENKGCTVTVQSADVSDYSRMNEIINELKQQYGKINGIIHCAGVAGDGFLFKKSIETFNSVINPKIHGTVILDTLTRDQKLDFFVMFSSIQSLLGGPGQGDYTAANAFLDTYASYLIKHGIKAHSINWPGWRETGMAFDYNIADSASVFKTLSTQTAIKGLNSIICYNLNNVVPSEVDFDFLAQYGEGERVYPIELSENLEKKLKRYQSKKNESMAQNERRILSVDELVLSGKNEDEYTETEKVVAYIYAAVLNMPEIDIYEDFTSMGGNSIIATELLKVLNNEFNGVLNISDVFTYSCVEEISAYIDTKLNVTVEEDVVKESYGDAIEKFESGDIDIDSMIEYFDE